MVVDGRLRRLNAINTRRPRSEPPRPRVTPRGVPPALQSHLIYSTADVVEAESGGRNLFGTPRIDIDPGTGEFSADFHAVLFRHITLGHLAYGAGCEVRTRRLPADQLVIMCNSGVVQVETTAGLVEASPVVAAIPTPGASMTLRCEPGAALLVIRIERNALATHLSRLLGKTPGERLVFEPELDLTAPTASRWNFAIQLLHAELFDDGSLVHDGVGIGHLEEFLMSALIFSHRSTLSEQLRSGQSQMSRVVRAARDYIDRHLSEPMTVGSIADAVGVSVRTLQSHFQTDLDMTPMAFVRDRRLERARDDLADATVVDGDSVTSVASRWGFGHLGRFSIDYRRRFGEAPSDTLRS